MSQARLTLIDKAFQKLDADGSGEVTFKDLQGVYKVDQHPKYQSGEMTRRQVLEEWLNSFEPEKDKRDGIVCMA